jgi:putrescine---pyruvate transaminase
MSAKPKITGRATRDWQELDARHYMHPFTDFRALAA